MNIVKACLSDYFMTVMLIQGYGSKK